MSMQRMNWLAVLLLGASLTAQEPRAEESSRLVIFARHLWTGDAVVQQRKIVISDGRIVEIAAAADRDVPSDAKVFEADWVLPGLVLADSTGLTGPTTEQVSVTPTLRALDGYDPFMPRPDILRSGVTAAYLSPGRTRLVAGQGAVVRPGVEELDAYVIKEVASLHCSVTQEALKPASIWEPPVAPAEDDEPFRPARRQFPQARGGAFMALRELFTMASDPNAMKAPANRYDLDLRGMKPLLDGSVPMRVRAETAPDIYGVLQVARRFKLPLVVEGATEAWKVAEELGAVKASVILSSGVDPTGKLPPPKPFRAAAGRSHPEAAAILKRAGVRVALVPPKAGGYSDLLWFASAARVKGGFDDEDVLRAVTSGAAAVLGVSEHAGTLRVGAPADVIAYDQSPLLAAAQPVLVVSAGVIVHSVKREKDQPIAIFARSVHPASGDPIPGGIIVVEDGRITAVGANVTVPPGAQRIDLPDAVVVPGFIDAGGQAGVRAYRTDDSGEITQAPPLTTLKLDQPPSQYFDPLFPDVAAVAGAGVTTLVITPGLGGTVSGPLSIVKTGGRPLEKSVVRKVAGILMDFSRAKWSQKALASLRRTLGSAKKYVDSWAKYEKDLATWKKKNPEGEPTRKEKKVGKVTAPAARDPVSGFWEGTAEAEGANVRTTADLKLQGTSVTGTVGCTLLPEGTQKIEGTYLDGHLRFELSVQGVTAKVDLEVLRDEMSGNWVVEEEGVSGRIFMKRTIYASPQDEKKPDKQDEKKPDEKKGDEKQPKKDAKKPDKAKGPPKAPKKVAALEPYKALFDLEIPVFFAASPSERLTREILVMFRDEFELKTVMISPAMATKVLDDMRRLGVGLACTGSGVFKDEGKWINPALEAVRAKLPVLFRSGDKGDPRTLYAIAAYAVRHGVDAQDALKMITRWPAQVLGLGKRVGTLQRGKDADLVILSGEPFVPGTRVLRVMVDGRFVAGQEKR